MEKLSSKAAHAAASKKYYEKNKVDINENRKRQYLEKKETGIMPEDQKARHALAMKKYYEKNAERIKAYNRDYSKKNRQAITEKRRLTTERQIADGTYKFGVEYQRKRIMAKKGIAPVEPKIKAVVCLSFFNKAKGY